MVTEHMPNMHLLTLIQFQQVLLEQDLKRAKNVDITLG